MMMMMMMMMTECAWDDSDHYCCYYYYYYCYCYDRSVACCRFGGMRTTVPSEIAVAVEMTSRPFVSKMMILDGWYRPIQRDSKMMMMMMMMEMVHYYCTPE